MSNTSKHSKIAKSMDWCDLACHIIELERKIGSYPKDSDDKQLKSLEKTLKIYEKEKEKRVLKSFDITRYI